MRGDRIELKYVEGDALPYHLYVGGKLRGKYASRTIALAVAGEWRF